MRSLQKILTAMLCIMWVSPVFAEPDIENYVTKTPKQYENYLSLAAIFRDEADYLKEWIEYNLLIGFEHIYLYNNLSCDHYLEVLQPYIDRGVVELIQWPYEHTCAVEWGRIQCNAYRDVLKRSKDRTKWLAILDTDEFIVPSHYNTLPELVRYYEMKDKKNKIARLELRWVVFGTSGVYRVPDDKLMIEMLTKNEGLHKLVKTIVRPEYATERVTPHIAHVKKGKKRKSVKPEDAVINHYMYRDQHFLVTVKVPRREKIGFSEQIVYNWEAACCEENKYSRNITRFIEPLRERMGF